MARAAANQAPAAKIPLFRPTIRRRQMHAVLECLVSEEIGPGTLARRLAREVAAALRLAGGVALADYGTALGAALAAVTSGAGSRHVLVPALAPLAYVQAAERLGLVPLLIDVDPESGALSRAALQRLMAYRPQAAVACRGVGQPGGAGALLELGLPLVEDLTAALPGLAAPEAAPAEPSAGAVVVVGLGAHAALAAGSGGLVLARARRDRRLLDAYRRDRGGEELSDVNAALALAQWQERAASRARCAELAARFRAALARGRHRTLPEAAAPGHLFPVLVADGMLAVRRYAARHRVETRLAGDDCALTRVAAPAAANGAAPPPADHLPGLDGARELARRCLLFPLYPALTDGAANRIAKVLATLP